MKTIVKVLGIILLIIVLAGVLLLWTANNRNQNYYKYTQTSGELEEKYTALGSEEISYKEIQVDDEIIKKLAIWYPSSLEKSDEKYPLVIFANGTGSRADHYKSFFKHLASWGFIVVGNDDENTRSGKSLNDTIGYLIDENSNKESVLMGKIDINNIGLAGHSQGGVGVFNMASKQSHKDKIKTIYTVSPTSSYHTNIFKDDWEYDLSLVQVPTLMFAGTGIFDAGTANAKEIESDEEKGIMQGITPLWSLKENFENLPENIDKVYARKKDVDHGDSHLRFDGYMTAWFRYYLLQDEDVGKVFFGERQEIKRNELYQDINIKQGR